MAIAVVEYVAVMRCSGRPLRSGCRSMSIRRVAAASMVVDRCMSGREVGGRGSRTRPVQLEEPVLLVPMTPAERSAAVAALADIIAAWWTRQQAHRGLADRRW